MSKRNKNQRHNRRKRNKNYKRRIPTGVETVFSLIQENPKSKDLMRATSKGLMGYDYQSLSKIVRTFYKQRRPVYLLEGDVVEEFVPQQTQFHSIDFLNLVRKNFPSTFVLDLSDSFTMFMNENVIDEIVDGTRKVDGIQDIVAQPDLKSMLGANSACVQFVNYNAEEGTFEISDIQNSNGILVYSMYYGDPNGQIGGSDYDKLGPHCIDCFVIWTDENNAHLGKDIRVSTYEEHILSKIDAVCEKNKISEESRETYGNDYLKAVAESLGIDFNWMFWNAMGMINSSEEPFFHSTKQFDDMFSVNGTDIYGRTMSKDNVNLIIDPEVLAEHESKMVGFVKTLLKTVLVKENCWRMVEGKDGLVVTKKIKLPIIKTRQSLLGNIVLSFLKSMSKTETILEESRKIAFKIPPRKKGSDIPRTYSFITVDPKKLAVIKRERKGSIRQSERYQREVEKYKQFKWVKESNLIEDEEIFDLKEGAVEILYKVRRSNSGYTRNKHLPKRDVSAEVVEKKKPLKVVRLPN